MSSDIIYPVISPLTKLTPDEKKSLESQYSILWRSFKEICEKQDVKINLVKSPTRSTKTRPALSDEVKLRYEI